MQNYLRSTVILMVMLLLCISVTNVGLARHNDDSSGGGTTSASRGSA